MNTLLFIAVFLSGAGWGLFASQFTHKFGSQKQQTINFVAFVLFAVSIILNLPK